MPDVDLNLIAICVSIFALLVNLLPWAWNLFSRGGGGGSTSGQDIRVPKRWRERDRWGPK